MVHRRDFIAGSGAAFGTALLCPEAVLEAEELGRARTVSVFHTTDLHGHIDVRPIDIHSDSELLVRFIERERLPKAPQWHVFRK